MTLWPRVSLSRSAGDPVDELAPNMRLKLTVRLAALARAQPGFYCVAEASAAKAPARGLGAIR